MKTTRTLRQRFFDRVVFAECGCWIWVGAYYPRGYGQFYDGKGGSSAHRWSYKQFKGEIPEGLELDHLCRTPCCVNPDHLEPVTHLENMRRVPCRKPAKRSPSKRRTFGLSNSQIELLQYIAAETGEEGWENVRVPEAFSFVISVRVLIRKGFVSHRAYETAKATGLPSYELTDEGRKALKVITRR